MHASQRGSVLLTVIAGILILAVVGTAALSLMTGSVMTVVDGRETVQAAYLAESGKEIVRAQTASKSGGALMEAAVSLTGPKKDDGKKFVVDGTGFVQTRLYPSWYRLHGDTWETTPFDWYGGAPTGNREWLVIPPNEAFDEPFRYKGQVGEHLETTAADVYLIGRVDGTPVYDASLRELRVKAKKGDKAKDGDKDDFYYFPESGGLIGLVAKQTNGDKTTVSDIRFLYDTLEKPKNGSQEYVFSNVTPFPESVGPETITAALEGHDVALGQYFRVECESFTDYGARSALVWHTNGRNSLRYADNGGSGGGEDVAVGGNNADELKKIFDGNVEGGNPKDEGLVKGDNIMGNLQKDDDELEWNFKDKGKDNIHGGNKEIEINHFLRQGESGNNQEYWWVAVARKWLAYQSGKSVPLESMMQYSFEPDSDDEDNKGKKDKDEEYQNYFTGILCRLAFVNASSSLSAEGTVEQGDGAQGIGVGVLQGEITFHNTENKVVRATVNPALLPGFSYKQKNFIISAEKREELYGVKGTPGTLGWVVEEGNKSYTRLYPLLVVWAYDDTKNGEAQGELKTLKPLAIAGLTQKNYLNVDDYLSLTVEVREEGGENHLTVWLKEKEDDLIEGDTPPQFPGPGKNLVDKWIYMAQDVSYKTDNSLSTTLAVGEAFRRVGIFSEAYAFKDMNDNHANIEIGNFFFTGTGSGGGSLFPGGLTPGIVN